MSSYAKFGNLANQDVSQPGPSPQQPFGNAPQGGHFQPPNQPPNQPPGQTVIKLSSAEHKNSIIAGNKIVVVDVYTDWCGPCKIMAPKFDQLAQKYSVPGHCVLVKEDAEDEITPSITSVPTFDFFYEGKQVARIGGGTTIDNIEAKLMELLAK